MKKIFYSLFSLTIMLTTIACSQKEESNSILKESKAPFSAPEFNNFKVEDYKEAFDRGFAEKRAEVKEILENKEAPTFENTIDALEMSGKTLDKVSSLFFTLNESEFVFGNIDSVTEHNVAVAVLTVLNGYSFRTSVIGSKCHVFKRSVITCLECNNDLVLSGLFQLAYLCLCRLNSFSCGGIYAHDITYLMESSVTKKPL